MKSTLNATLSFGLVNVPVGIAPATTEKELVKFKQLHGWCGTPIRTEKVCDECELTVATDELVRGYEVAKATFVRVENEEYESIRKARQPLVKINKYVPWAETAMLPRKRTYFLIPAQGLAGGYSLMVDALCLTEADAFGYCNLWGKDSPFLVSVTNGVLVLHLLHTFAELVEPDFDVPLSEDLGLSAELKVATQIVRGSMGSLDLELELRAEDQEAMLMLIEDKKQGLEPSLPIMEKPIAASLDLMEVLKASIPATAKPKKKVKV